MSISQGGSPTPLDAQGDIRVNSFAGLVPFSTVINLAASSNAVFVIPGGGRLSSGLVSTTQATASTTWQPSFDGGVTYLPNPAGTLSITNNTGITGSLNAIKFTNASGTNAAVITIIGLYYAPS